MGRLVIRIMRHLNGSQGELRLPGGVELNRAEIFYDVVRIVSGAAVEFRPARLHGAIEPQRYRSEEQQKREHGPSEGVFDHS